MACSAAVGLFLFVLLLRVATRFSAPAGVGATPAQDVVPGMAFTGSACSAAFGLFLFFPLLAGVARVSVRFSPSPAGGRLGWGLAARKQPLHAPRVADMNAITAERNAFDPPPADGFTRALVLALLAHLLLILALTWGLRWKNEPQDDAVEAELWSPTAQQAAPRAAPKPPDPVVQPPPPPPPKPEPVVKAPPPPPKPAVDEQQRDAEIALAQKKKREEELRQQAEAREEKRRQEAERRELAEKEREKKELAQKKAAEQERREAQRKELAEKKAADEAKRKEQLAKAEAEKKEQAERKAAEAKKAEAAADKRAEIARRQKALERMTALAGSADSDGGSAAAGNGAGKGKAGGNDARDAGPSGNYAARIRAAVRPNIVFTDDVPGNPVAEVEVRTGPTGTIISRRISKSSGVKSWDEAVLRALDRTEKLPSDNGRYWNPMEIVFKLRD